MEEWIVLLIPAFVTLSLVRTVLRSVKWALWLGIHWACGFVCLWLLNLGTVILPVNAVTVLTAGFLGLPGIGLLVVLSFL